MVAGHGLVTDYWHGVDVGDNPHEDDMDEWRLWEEGWKSARKHDYDESEG
jgi:hypothetical protein